ncbi:hypothetical protein BDR26DRAFT_1011331 [Obelidium mucronatum]|nr:hypothetical protein BDR26DRAFT_1011331 [Obelidium mucronatum]
MTKTRRDLGVERMGTYMLSGWVLTDAACATPGCNVPTFRSRDSKKVNVCCLCHDASDPVPVAPDFGGAAPEFADSGDAAKFGAAESCEDRPPPAAPGASESDRVSAMLGEKLLAGWTMLSSTCSKCHITPLMEKGGLAICVKCGSDSQVNVVQPSKVARVTINEAKKDKEVEEEKEEEDEEFWNELLESAPPSKYTVHPPPPVAQSKREPPHSYSESKNVLASLEGRLQSLTASLNNVGTNYTECKSICEAIKACAEAIESCRRI